MIVRCGCDLVELSRFARKLEGGAGRLERRIFDERERDYCRGSAEKAAAVFAAKEALAKALGSGIWGEAGIGFGDFHIRHESSGRPVAELSPKALAFAAAIGELVSADLSLSHDGGYAMAFCTLVFRKKAEEQTDVD